MTQPRPVLTLAGSRVALGPLRRDLIPLYHAWISNLETTQFLSEAGSIVTLDEEIAWFDSAIRKSDTRSMTIYTYPACEPIGVINLHQINQRHRKANMGIMIGESAQRGKGLGTEAIRLLLDIGFNAMNLHSIWLTTYPFNEAGLRAYARAGFREVGRRRECRWHAGRYWDEIHMDILSSEFGESLLPGLIQPGTI